MAPLTPLPDSPSDRRDAFIALKERVAAMGRRVAVADLMPTALPELDALLGGGFPTSALVTLEGEAHSGRWSIAARLLAVATARGLAAVIDEGELYPPALAQAGVRLDRLLIVPAHTPIGIARAADILVRSRACRVVVMPAPRLRAAVWSRLAGLAHRLGTLLIVIATRVAQELTNASLVRMKCVLEEVMLRGSRGLWCTLRGFRMRVELCKRSSGRVGATAHMLSCIDTDGAPLRRRAIGSRHLRAVESGV